MQHRSFSTVNHRPSPNVDHHEDDQLIIVSTSWGNKEEQETVSQLIKDYFFNFNQDTEATTPYDYIEGLPRPINQLLASVNLTNESIYNQFNKDEYIAGVELFTGTISGNCLYWVQVGQPNLYVLTNENMFLPMATKQDFISGHKHSPLPTELLGTYQSNHFNTGSCHLKNVKKLFFVSGNISLVDMPSQQDVNIDTIAEFSRSKNPESPLWVGEIEL